MRKTVIVDIGASLVDGPPVYEAMLAKGLCEVVGFEADKAALDVLNRQKGPNETYRPDVIYDGEPAMLHHAALPGMTSLLKPDVSSLRLFHRFERFGEIQYAEPVQTVTLDDALGSILPDFIKADVQGAELAILSHAPRALAHAVAVQVEVSFVPLYERQPTFGAVDGFMREHGFMLHRFMAVKAWPLLPGEPVRSNQLLEADAVYIKDIRRPLSQDQWERLALLAEHVFDAPDLKILAESKVTAATVAGSMAAA